MKKMLVLMLIFITIGLFADEAKPLQQMTLSELSEVKGIRLEKLAELIVPSIDTEASELPLEKIDAGLTTEFIQGALDNYLQLRTLRDLAEDTKYPIKKLSSILGLEIGKTGYEKPLRDFGISPQRIKRAIRTYEAEETDFLWSIIATGMIIVFASLILTGLVVALLEYFHRLGNQRTRRKILTKPAIETTDTTAAELRRNRRKRAKTTRTAADEMDAHTIVAIAAAIRLHESSMEEANRILATWTKASVSTWKASRMMPNRRFFDKRRG
jgi:hypothetical protein